MSCYLCGSKKYIEVLNKKDGCIWTGASDEEKKERRAYACILHQCQVCGHVYQSVDENLRRILNEIYLSNHAQASTPTGVGNWGLKRAQIFLNKIEAKKYTSAVEIGCADGYLLRCLKDKGLKKLVGIEPSISKTEERDGILFLKEFADEKLKLPQKHDLIFSNSVFEHTEDINSIIRFCRNNLKEEGEIFFTVPNAQPRLEDGDPGLFLHEHVHYYTQHSAFYLLQNNGFEVLECSTTNDSLDVRARVNGSNAMKPAPFIVYDDYEAKLKRVLQKVDRLLEQGNILVHGANNSLNNMLAWMHKPFDFTLVDNDETKHGKTYCGQIVRPLVEIDLSHYNTVLIIPVAFYNTIRNEYVERGFKGKIKNILNLPV